MRGHRIHGKDEVDVFFSNFIKRVSNVGGIISENCAIFFFYYCSAWSMV